MKKTILKKTSGILAVMLAVSMLVPLLALASGFMNFKYDSNGTVTGQVYFDGTVGDAVYAGGGNVTLNIAGQDGYTSTTTATYDHYDGTNYYYDITPITVPKSTYDPITITTPADSTVSKTVYREEATVTPPCYTCGGGGGGIIIPPTSGTTVGADGKISASTLSNLLQNNPDITLTLEGNFVLLPASALTNGNSVKLVTDDASYTLPLSVLHLDTLARDLNVSDLSNLFIKVSLADVAGDDATAINNAAAAIGATQVNPAIDFSVTVVDQDSKVLDTFKTFDAYVSRTITLSQNVDPAKVAGVTFDPATKKFAFVPSTFADNNGNSIATMMRKGNSIYTVIQVSKNFNDISDNWAKDTIQLLADKLIIYGETPTTFEPQHNITRAEWASLITEALGLPKDASAAAKFSDVPANFWGASVIGAAANAGIIYGDGDGKFRPNDNITREELASLMDEALKYVGKQSSLTAAQQTAALATFTDAASITWGKADIAALVNAKIILGYPDHTYKPAAQATRAESAEMLKLFLQYVDFIN